MSLLSFLNKLPPKQLFLMDGFGALLSAFSLGIILPLFESNFGMPREALYFLAAWPCFFALYDFICYFRIEKSWQPFLRGIAIANLIYCCISISFLLQHYQKLTTLGWLYFSLELAIVIIIAGIELKTAARSQ